MLVASPKAILLLQWVGPPSGWRKGAGRLVAETRHAGPISLWFSPAETNEETAAQIPHQSATEVSSAMPHPAAGVSGKVAGSSHPSGPEIPARAHGNLRGWRYFAER